MSCCVFCCCYIWYMYMYIIYTYMYMGQILLLSQVSKAYKLHEVHAFTLLSFMHSTLSPFLHTSLPPSPKLHLERGVIDMGTLLADHQIHTTSFPLSNHGDKTGTFVIDASPLPAWICLQPLSGQLEPNESTDIQVHV